MSTPIHERFPAITTATALLALDNGGISRIRTLEQVLVDLDGMLGFWVDQELREIDAWLATLTAEQLSIVCTGEWEEQKALVAGAPVRTEKLLNEIFEKAA